MTPIERELIELTNFKPIKKYEKKQDYIAALARLVDQLSDRDFDKLSKEAVDWFNAAAIAISRKMVIPDFTDAVPSSEMEPPEEDIDDADLFGAEDPEIAPRTEAPPKKKRHRAPGKRPGTVLNIPYPQPKPLKGHGPLREGRARDNRDKYGFVIGSKSSKAVAMLEQGCRMIDIKASIGGTYYTVIGRCIKRGHKIEHGANGYIKLTYQGKEKQ